jgi:recombinational DNA repair ATPase RecF
MRLLELEISNIRGIKAARLTPDSQNFVVWGPNGSGKSAVVDAIDFLLTGKISRLVGEGTAGITLKAHGPHVDHKPQEARVSAIVEIPTYKTPIQLKRSMGSPAKLEYPPAAKGALQPILDVAAKGQHVLSRRQILRFVAAEAGKRANEVQALLDLSELENIRKALTKTENTAKADKSSAEMNVGSAKNAILLTLGLPIYDEQAILQDVNRRRTTLGGTPITLITRDSLKAGLVAPTASTRIQGVNPQLLRSDLDQLKRNLERAPETMAKPDQQLRAALTAVKENARALAQLKKLKLFQLGVSMIEQDGACPLCGTPWPVGELRRHLEEHIASAEAVDRTKKTIERVAGDLGTITTTINDILGRIVTTAGKLELKDDALKLGEWSARLKTLSEDLAEPLEKYPRDRSPLDVAKLLTPEGALEITERIVQEAEKRLPPVTPEQAAWDVLTRLEENLQQRKIAEQKSDSANRLYQIAQVLSSTFEESRDSVLSALYKEIESRFTDFYRTLHGDDEPGFQSTLRPEGAGLVLEVDFYGRGKFPPLAVHSEGHQDTMGICLYLALAEKLTGGLIDLVILDDVVMSVDAGHRRQICRLLSEKLPGRQFLITTHDKTWARQLVTTGVVSHKNTLEFSNWSIDTGPLLGVEADLWAKIENDTKAGDIPTAAQRLRRGAEQFFEYTCDGLRGAVVYRSDARYELSDFSSSAVGAYKKYLKQAKAAAHSWSSKPDVEKLQELESIATQIIIRSQIEQWAINENVHYNRWGEFQPADFAPVVEAWRDLFQLFQCSDCATPLFVTLNSKNEPSALRCRCGKVNWNLIPK